MKKSAVKTAKRSHKKKPAIVQPTEFPFFIPKNTVLDVWNDGVLYNVPSDTVVTSPAFSPKKPDALERLKRELADAQYNAKSCAETIAQEEAKRELHLSYADKFSRIIAELEEKQ